MYSQLKFIDRENHTHVLRCDYFYSNSLFLANYLVTLLNDKKLTPQDFGYLVSKLKAFIEEEKILYKSEDKC